MKGPSAHGNCRANANFHFLQESSKSMFKIAKFLLFIIMLLSISSMTTYAQNPVGQIFKTCTASEDCSAVIPAEKTVGLCDAQPAQVAWHKDSHRYIVQCDCHCTENSNKIWIADEDTKMTWRINFGKYVTKQLFASSVSPKVPDKFSSHSMCHAAKKNLIEKSNFVVLDKIPSPEGDDPYCYEPYYIISENENIYIQDNFHQLSENEPNSLFVEKHLVTLKKINEIIELTK